MGDNGNAIPGKIYIDESGIKYIGTESRRVVRYLPDTIVSRVGITGSGGISVGGTNPITDSGTININGNGSGSGTITEIDTAGLLSGGPITSSGTITTSMSTGKLVGRSTSGVGVMEEIMVGAGLTLSGGILSSTNGSVIPITRVDFIALWVGSAFVPNAIYKITDSAVTCAYIYIQAVDVGQWNRNVVVVDFKNANMVSAIPTAVGTYNVVSDSLMSYYYSDKNVYVVGDSSVTNSALSVLPFDNNNIYNVNIVGCTVPVYTVSNDVDVIVHDSNLYNCVLNLTANAGYTLPLTISNSNLNYCTLTLWSEVSPITGGQDVAVLNGCTINSEATIELYGATMDGCLVESGANVVIDSSTTLTNCKVGAGKSINVITNYNATGKFIDGYYSNFEAQVTPDVSEILSIDAYLNFCGILNVVDSTYAISTITGNRADLYIDIVNRDTGNILTINDHSIGNNVYVHPFETSGNHIDLKNGESVKVISSIGVTSPLFVTERRHT